MEVHGRLSHQVFINFRGDELRCGFVSHLVEALKRHEIKVFIDEFERRGVDLTNLFVRIEESTIALVIFSRRYTESVWCLDELVRIKERSDQGLLQVVPIFFKVEPVTVKELRGVFGDQFRDRQWEYRSDKSRTKRWKKAVGSVSCKMGLTFDKKSNESKFVRIIVKEVKKILRLDDSSLGVQRSILAYTQEPLELSRERVLMGENSKIANQIVLVSKDYTDIECENDILRAQLNELSGTLSSLNSIIEMVEGVVGTTPHIPDFLMNPWQIPCSSQSIMASADMFQY